MELDVTNYYPMLAKLGRHMRVNLDHMHTMLKLHVRSRHFQLVRAGGLRTLEP